jgi:hypothetical protein
MTDVLQDPLLWREYSKELGDFLSERLGIEPDDLPRSNGWAGSGNSIGALALRLGELAKHLGFCTDKDIHRLLAMQRLYRCLDQTALLVIDGRFEVADLLRHLADFAAEGGIE